MRGILKNSNFFLKLISLILVFLFFSILGGLLGIFLAGNDLTDISTIRLLQLVQAVSTFIIPPFVLAYLWSDKPVEYLQINRMVSLKSVALVICFMILIIPFINLLTELNQRILFPDFLSGLENYLMSKEKQTAELTERLLDVNTIGGLLFNIFLISILPAVGEELFFRGTIQRVIQDWKHGTLAVWLTAFIFSAAHFQFYGFIPRFLLGLVLGYLFLWSRNLWIPIIAHFTNNFLVVIYFYFTKQGYSLVDLDAIGTGNTWWIGIISGCVFLVGIIFLKRYFTGNFQKKKVPVDRNSL